MRYLNIYLIYFFTSIFSTWASESPYKIEVQLNEYSEKEIYLAYHYGNKTYIKDTASLNSDGKFIFSGKQPLPPGLYMVVLKPNNNFFEFLVDNKNQQFSLSTSMENLTRDMDVIGSQDNRLLYQYLNYTGTIRSEISFLQKNSEKNETDSSTRRKRIDELNKNVKEYQKGLIQRYSNTLFALFLKANMPPEQDLPSFEGNEASQKNQRYQWARLRWFDHINLANSFFIRTPNLWERVNSYLTNMTVQSPDSVIIAVEEVLNRAKLSEETFKFLLIELLNNYAKSRIVGMDKVYVHIVEKYYETGVANWVEAQQLKKIVDNARALRPILLGVKAPDLRVETVDGMQFNLHNFKAQYIVLYFWNNISGNSVKELETLKTVANKYREKGIRIVTIYSGSESELQKKFNDALQKYGMDSFLNTVDINKEESGSLLYNLKVLPQLFVLDNNMKIIMKSILATQLSGVLDSFLSK